MDVRDKDIVSLKLSSPDVHTWLKEFSTLPGENVSLSYQQVDFPEDFGLGYAVTGWAEEGIQFRLIHYKSVSDMSYTASASPHFRLILHFYLYSGIERLYMKSGEDLAIESTEKNYSIILTSSSKYAEELFVSKGSTCKGLTIEVSGEWLEKRVSFDGMNGREFFEQKAPFPAMLSPRSQTIIGELFDKKKPRPSPHLFYKARILKLLENYFENLLAKEFSTALSKISGNDVESLMRVERYITANYTLGFPGIDKLAQMAFMSPTKLKTTFKKAFGLTVYDYFQKKRLQKARELLGTAQFSVADVALQIGYQSFSNFSIAYKKEFGYLPSEFEKWEDGL